MGDTRLTVGWGTAEVKLGVYISTQPILSRATPGFHTWFEYKLWSRRREAACVHYRVTDCLIWQLFSTFSAAYGHVPRISYNFRPKKITSGAVLIRLLLQHFLAASFV